MPIQDEKIKEGQGVEDVIERAGESFSDEKKYGEDVKNEGNFSLDQQREKINEKMAQERIQQISPTSVGSDDDDDDDDDDKKKINFHAKDISEMEDAETKIAKLVELAQEKDPILAIKIAKHLDENYVLDKLHDRLMEDEIKAVLIEKGLIKE